MFIKKYFRVHAGLFEHEKSWILKNLGPSTTREEHFLIFVIWRKCPDLWHQNLQNSFFLQFSIFFEFFWPLWRIYSVQHDLNCSKFLILGSQILKIYKIHDFETGSKSAQELGTSLLSYQLGGGKK